MPDDSGAMLRKERRFWKNCVLWQAEWFTCIGAEILGNGALRKLLLESRRKNQTEVVVKRNQEFVKGGVVKPGQAKAVADIEPFGGMRAPRQDVRRYQQVAHSQRRHAAATTEVVQHRLPKILLPTPEFHIRRRLRRTHWRTLPHPYAFPRQHLEFTILISTKQLPESFLARRHRVGEICMKLGPDFAVERARALQSFDAPQLQSQIKRGEVAEFHGHAVRAAPEFFRERDNRGMPCMKLPERQFVIEVQRDEQLVARPAFSGCHVWRLPLPSFGAKPENACRCTGTWPGISAELWPEPNQPD
jgi:hypothetical protein